MKKIVPIVFAAAVLCAAYAGVSAQSTLNKKGRKVFPADKGPEKIDVSKYPPEQRKAYKLVRKRCSKCHTFARAVNSEYVLKREWRSYVKKMKKKRRSGIRKKEVKTISDFLIFDSKTRKRALWKKKLKAWKEKRAAERKRKDASKKKESK